MRTVVIVHRWDGKPKGDWYPWLKKELERKGYHVIVPTMPDTAKPNMHAWIMHLEKVLPNPNTNTIFVGHSIGCQTILRYASMLSKNLRIGKIILVAPWMKLQGIEEEPDSAEIARPWIETPISWSMVKEHCKDFMCFFSDNDPYVAKAEEKFFKKNLKAQTHMLKKLGHFTKDEGVKELPIILNEF